MSGIWNSCLVIVAVLICSLPIGVSSFRLLPPFGRRVGHYHSQEQTNRHLRQRGCSVVTMVAFNSVKSSDMSFSFSRRIESTLDPCVVLMKEMIGEYSAQWEDRGGIYSLAQGVVYWKPPLAAKEAQLDSLQRSDDPNDMLHMYGPDEGLPELRDALQAKIRAENDLVNHHVMVTVGANQAYMNCVLALIDDRHKAVVFKPYYFNHVMALQMVMTNATNQLLVGPSSADGIPDLNWLEERLLADDSIQMVTITNPCNPTGVLLERSVLHHAVDLCREHHVWLVLDCTYEYFVYDDALFDGCFSDDHVIHIFSLSKAYAMAGYRCGYMTMSKAADPLFQQVMKVQGTSLLVEIPVVVALPVKLTQTADTIPICPSRISQVGALGSLTAGREWVRSKVATLSDSRRVILEALEPCAQVMGGSGAMYVMCRVGGDDQEFARKLVQDYGVAVIPGSFCGFPGWIRVCYANLSPELCLMAAERLGHGIKGLLSIPK